MLEHVRFGSSADIAPAIVTISALPQQSDDAEPPMPRPVQTGGACCYKIDFYVGAAALSTQLTKIFEGLFDSQVRNYLLRE